MKMVSLRQPCNQITKSLLCPQHTQYNGKLYRCTSVTPPIRSYTNHTRKRVRSRSGTRGKISQHNSTNKISHTSIILQARGLEFKSSIIDESVEATISEYRHKLNKFSLRRLTQTEIQIERGAGLLPGILLNYSWSSSVGCT